MTDLKKLAEEYGLSADQSLLKIEVARRAYLAGAEAFAALAMKKIDLFVYPRDSANQAAIVIRSLLPEVST